MTGPAGEDPRCTATLLGSGGCDATSALWLHNAETGECERALYHGCDDGPLLFTALEECESVCGLTSTTTTTTTTTS